jgi:hypothetical protein
MSAENSRNFQRTEGEFHHYQTDPKSHHRGTEAQSETRLPREEDRSTAPSPKRNPWEIKIYGRTCITCDATSRIDRLKSMTAAELRDVLAWPDTQKTVRAAARRALDKIVLAELKEFHQLTKTTPARRAGDSDALPREEGK